MPLDPANALIGDWDTDNNLNEPDGGDLRKQGDDQIRGAKGTVRRHFPNFVGTASVPKTVLVNEDEINTLSGINTGGTVESRLAALEATDALFPGGGVVVLPFFQVSALAGWTQQTDTEIPGLDNSMLRVVQTAGGGLGGTDSPILMDKVPVHDHPASSVSAGSHKHDIRETTAVDGGDFPNFIDYTTLRRDFQSDVVVEMNQAGSHSHTITVSNNAGGNAGNWEPKYADFILASKD